MPTIQGTDGAFSAVGFAAKFLSWRATLEGREFNTTGFGDGGWITGKIINGRVTGDAIGIIDASAVPVPAAAMNATFGVGSMEGEVVLTLLTGKTWTFDALFTAVELGRAEEGAGSSTYRISFASTGEVVQAWGA